jgi:phosphoglycerate kinase
MGILSLSELKFAGKKALVRVDFNVPLSDDGSIADTLKISESLPTIRYILKQGGSVILFSHLGNLDKSQNRKDSKFSLRPCGIALSKLLGQEVLFAEDCLGEETKKKVTDLKEGQVLLLENLRFYPAEEKPELDPSFAETLASYGDVYINDAFATCHRKHSSITCLPKKFLGAAAAGFLLEKEIKALSRLSTSPLRPFHAIVGGSKVSSKLGVLRSLLEKADALYIGGAMAFTFFKALGYRIGNSLFEPDLVPRATDLMNQCAKRKICLFLPEDILEADAFSNNASKKIITISKEGIDEGWQGMDIGPKTLTAWQHSLKEAGSIFWNGPVGVFELPAFSEGTFSLVKFLSSLSCCKIVGGGDSAAAVHQTGLNKKFTHMSTGGGASLEFIEHGTLPGIEALTH